MTLFSNGCPKCKVLIGKLDAKNCEYIKTEDFSILQENNIKMLPVLELDGELLDFGKAIAWINKQ